MTSYIDVIYVTVCSHTYFDVVSQKNTQIFVK